MVGFGRNDRDTYLRILLANVPGSRDTSNAVPDNNKVLHGCRVQQRLLLVKIPVIILEGDFGLV